MIWGGRLNFLQQSSMGSRHWIEKLIKLILNCFFFGNLTYATLFRAYFFTTTYVTTEQCGRRWRTTHTLSCYSGSRLQLSCRLNATTDHHASYVLRNLRFFESFGHCNVVFTSPFTSFLRFDEIEDVFDEFWLWLWSTWRRILVLLCCCRRHVCPVFNGKPPGREGRHRTRRFRATWTQNFSPCRSVSEFCPLDLPFQGDVLFELSEEIQKRSKNKTHILLQLDLTHYRHNMKFDQTKKTWQNNFSYLIFHRLLYLSLG